jgi:hypothetical protein
MMTKDFEFYHGVVFARILHATKRQVSIKLFPSPSNASYIVDNSIGLYIKHSTKRLTPWHFTFKREHQAELELMKSQCNSIFLILVCHDDGIVCLDESELKQILDEQHDPIEWMR